jgi:hypothetical protein
MLEEERSWCSRKRCEKLPGVLAEALASIDGPISCFLVTFAVEL